MSPIPYMMTVTNTTNRPLSRGGHTFEPGVETDVMVHSPSAAREITACRSLQSSRRQVREELVQAPVQEEETRVQEEEEAPDVHICPHCGFEAKSSFGLRAHIRAKHEDEEV